MPNRKHHIDGNVKIGIQKYVQMDIEYWKTNIQAHGEGLQDLCIVCAVHFQNIILIFSQRTHKI